jgi:arsenite-transporting ATPase
MRPWRWRLPARAAAVADAALARAGITPGLVSDAPRFVFFTGKGGVGKTSVASAVAVALAGRGTRVLLVSTDPASNLDEVLGTRLGPGSRPVPGVAGLAAANLDPLAAAAAYRERVVGPYRGVLPASAVASIEEQLSGACTVEIAAFDEFTALLADPSATAGFDHVIFDTAPTGHTLRLLSLPGAWTGFIDASTLGTSCIGPLAGLSGQQAAYREALAALADPARTVIVLVARPDPLSLAEADRASGELGKLGITSQRLVINGVLRAPASGDVLAETLAERAGQALDSLPEALAGLPRDEVPLAGWAPVGISGLRALATGVPPVAPAPEPVPVTGVIPFGELVDDLAAREHGLVMTMGKGGVGKTTLAVAIAAELTRRGHEVELTTTDPAAHLDAVLGSGGTGAGDLRVSRIDPAEVTAAYVAEVLASAGAGLDGHALAVLEEDLRSPCTEEIAVFRAFAATVAAAEARFVVVDTAPTGHTLLLLDAARAYHREAGRQAGGVPPEVEALLGRLTDPAFTQVLIVTLPEATPVHEAAALQADLRRAGIEPAGWVVNQSLHAAGVSDPVLAARAAAETRHIGEITSRHAARAAILPMLPAPPAGPGGITQLLAGVPAVSG